MCGMTMLSRSARQVLPVVAVANLTPETCTAASSGPKRPPQRESDCLCLKIAFADRDGQAFFVIRLCLATRAGRIRTGFPALPPRHDRNGGHRGMLDAAGDIQAWILGAGLEGISQAELVTGYCERLAAAGLPIWRASVGADTLHPLIDAQGHRWVAGKGLHVELFPRVMSPKQNDAWQRSTWKWMLDNGTPEMRLRMARGEGVDRFPLVAELAAKGERITGHAS
jgi:hypothetical protein